jgi:hypothetical protein
VVIVANRLDRRYHENCMKMIV